MPEGLCLKLKGAICHISIEISDKTNILPGRRGNRQ